jgi:hypothetical protein
VIMAQTDRIFRSSITSTPPALNANVYGNANDMWQNTTITTTGTYPVVGTYPMVPVPADGYEQIMEEAMEEIDRENLRDNPFEDLPEGVAPNRDINSVEAERAKRFGASLEVERARRIAKEASAVLAEAKILVGKLVGALGQQEEEELQARLDAIEEELGEENIGV